MRDPFVEFRRILSMSRLALDGDEMSDDQRDAMCNLGESLGLTGGQAEDLIDEYLEQAAGMPPTPMPPSSRGPAVAVAPPKPIKPASPAPASRPTAINVTPLARSLEKQRYANFVNSVQSEMLLVTSGAFKMGSVAPEANAHEQPVTPVTIGCFFMSRHPITNAQFEAFAPGHLAKRASWANERHPVVYVSSREAESFCQWLSQKEGKRYRLPTEAEWEYAARGTEGRTFPWGERCETGHFANFADVNTAFPWRNAAINDGFAETAPVGSFPRGASAFGIEDLAGNVFEWCLDFYEPYRGKDVTNRRGPNQGAQRIYRGGSWRSKMTSLRASARHFNLPDYSSNDVGFRVVCEAE